MSELLTVEEAANYFRVSRFTIYNWVKSGLLRGLKLGGVFRFRSEDIEEFLKSEGSEGKSSVA